jgi:hypothetical protein
VVYSRRAADRRRRILPDRDLRHGDWTGRARKSDGVDQCHA